MTSQGRTGGHDVRSGLICSCVSLEISGREDGRVDGLSDGVGFGAGVGVGEEAQARGWRRRAAVRSADDEDVLRWRVRVLGDV